MRLEPPRPWVFPDAACCARAASGHAAAPLSAAMNSRRRIRPSRKGRGRLAQESCGSPLDHPAACACGFLSLIQSSHQPERSRELGTAAVVGS
jgi:hypothetical protein